MTGVAGSENPNGQCCCGKWCSDPCHTKSCQPMPAKFRGETITPKHCKNKGFLILRSRSPAPKFKGYELAPSRWPYPQYGWDFPEEILEKFWKDPGNALRVFPEFPPKVRLGPPKPYHSRISNLQSISRIISPSIQLGTPLFSEVVSERASQSWS